MPALRAALFAALGCAKWQWAWGLAHAELRWGLPKVSLRAVQLGDYEGELRLPAPGAREDGVAASPLADASSDLLDRTKRRLSDLKDIKEGVTICTCDCQIDDGPGETSASMGPAWNQRVSPGNVVDEMEQLCHKKVCPEQLQACRALACRDRHACDQSERQHHCKQKGPALAECHYTPNILEEENSAAARSSAPLVALVALALGVLLAAA